MPEIVGDVDELLTAVRHAARSEARDIRNTAEEEAEKIRRKGREEAKAERSRILGEARAEAERIRGRKAAPGRGGDREAFLKTRESLLEDIWQKAEERLQQLVEDENAYVPVLRRTALAAAAAFGGGRLRLFADEAGRDLLTEERLKEWSRKAESSAGAETSFERAGKPAAVGGGLIAEDPEAGRRLDASFPSMLEKAREELRTEIYRELTRT